MSPTPTNNTAMIEPVEKATTVVPTQTLQNEGIEKIRVVSQSMFVKLVRGMVEESIHSRLASADPDSSAVCQAQWESLRHRHEDKLVRIESGMRQLSETFESIQTLLEGAGIEALEHPATQSSKTGARAATPSQQDLLREMLL